MDYEAVQGLSRTQIRHLSKVFRKILKVKTLVFPVIKVLTKLEKICPNNLYVSVDEDSEFEENIMAYLDPEGDDWYCIHIRESVYEGALEGKGDCLGFICHEICHFLLVFFCEIGPKIYKSGSAIVYAMSVVDRSIPAYKSMEWQAKALCGEIMIDYDRCKDMSLKQIISKTKSSREQAQYFLEKVVNK